MSKFDSFRDKLTPKAPPAPGGAPSLAMSRGREPYESFGTKDKLHRLDLRANDGLSHALPYSHLLLLSYNRRTYAEIFLTISGMAATIKGRNMRPIVDALKLHTCEFIQAFDPAEFLQPNDDGTPYVERVTVELIGAKPRKEA